MRTREELEAVLIAPRPFWARLVSKVDWRDRVQRVIALELLLDVRELLVELKSGAEGSR